MLNQSNPTVDCITICCLNKLSVSICQLPGITSDAGRRFPISGISLPPCGAYRLKRTE